MKLVLFFVFIATSAWSQNKQLETAKIEFKIDEDKNLVFINVFGQKQELASDILYSGRIEFWVNDKDSMVIIYATSFRSPFNGTNNALYAHLDFYKFNSHVCVLQKSFSIEFVYDSWRSVDLHLSSAGILEVTEKKDLLFGVDVRTITEKGFQLLHDMKFKE